MLTDIFVECWLRDTERKVIGKISQELVLMIVEYASRYTTPEVFGKPDISEFKGQYYVEHAPHIPEGYDLVFRVENGTQWGEIVLSKEATLCIISPDSTPRDIPKPKLMDYFVEAHFPITSPGAITGDLLAFRSTGKARIHKGCMKERMVNLIVSNAEWESLNQTGRNYAVCSCLNCCGDHLKQSDPETMYFFYREREEFGEFPQVECDDDPDPFDDSSDPDDDSEIDMYMIDDDEGWDPSDYWY